MDKEKKIKNVKKVEEPSGEENFLLKKIRYYQGTIKDYDTFWNEKIAEGEREESPETKAFAKRNAELNKAFEIIPVEKDDTVICTDVVSGQDGKSSNDKPSDDEKKEKKEEKHEEEEEVKEKEEKKEEKGEEEEEVKEKDEKKEEKGDDDGDEKKKKKKEE